MRCDRCPSIAAFSAMGVRFCPLSKRPTIPAAVPAQKGLPAKLRCVLRVREDPAGPWTGRPSFRLAAHPATETSSSSIRPAQRRPRICLSAPDSIPVCSPRRVHGTDNASVVILRRTTTRFSRKGESLAELSAFFPRPRHAGRTPGCARLARQINAKRGLGLAEEECLRRGSGSEWSARIGSAARCGRRAKERVGVLSREGRIAVGRSFKHYPG